MAKRAELVEAKIKPDRYGVCALTGRSGKLVKSHLLPRALMDFGPTDAPIIQIRGDATRPIKRWSSWYDPRLVTRAGEDILEKHDNWGVSFLRHHGLVWSSWGPDGGPAPDDDQGVFGIRLIDGVDTGRLRMFLLSLLWRAAASGLPEFAAVQVPADHLERLRVALTTSVLPDQDFYPATLMQFSTRGDDHIWAPEAVTMPVFNDEGAELAALPAFRFYMDGAIVLFRATTDVSIGLGEGVGITKRGQLFVQTIPFAHSRQVQAMGANFEGAARAFRSDMTRFNLLG